MSSLSLTQAANPLPGDVNPFDRLPDEVVVEIASHIKHVPSLWSFEGACLRFHTFAVNLLEAGNKLLKFTMERPFTHVERKELETLLKATNIGYSIFNHLNAHQARQILTEVLALPHLEILDPSEEGSRLEQEIKECLKVFNKRANQFHWTVLDNAYFDGLERFVGTIFQISLNDDTKIEYLEITKIDVKKIADTKNLYILPTKFDFTQRKIINEAIFEILEIYRGQDIKNITLESFKESVQLIYRQGKGYQKNSTIIEHLRLATKRSYESAERRLQRTNEIEAIRRELLTIADNPSRMISARKSLEKKLNVEKAYLEDERLKLCGPTGFDGEIHSAFVAMEEAGNEYNEYRDPNVYREWESRKDHFQGLKRLLSKIAEFDQAGQIIGGDLFDIEQQLQPQAIDQATRNKIEREARFYELLNGALFVSVEERENSVKELETLLDLEDF